MVAAGTILHAALRDPRLISGKRVSTFAAGLPTEARQAFAPLYEQIDLQAEFAHKLVCF